MFVSIAVTNEATVVKVYQEAAATNLIEAFAYNDPKDYQLRGKNLALIFEEAPELTNLGIRFDNLTTATATALSSPASQEDLFDALITLGAFKAYNVV